MNELRKPEILLANCTVRLAEERDRADLLIVAKGIWGGSDYLPRVLDRWLGEPWFLVCEYRGKAIACLKMTLFPDNVLWFEGLRVHHRYQGQGIATLMNRRAFALAEEEKRRRPELAFEFCTYYQNVESLHLTQKLGFKVAESFYILDKRGCKATQAPEILPDIELQRFRNYDRHIPCAWQAVHRTEASLPFLREHGKMFKTPNAVYYLGGLHEPTITLLEAPTAKLRTDLPYLQHFFGSRKSYSVILPLKFKSSVPLLRKLGFRFWEGEEAENMLVLSM